MKTKNEDTRAFLEAARAKLDKANSEKKQLLNAIFELERNAIFELEEMIFEADWNEEVDAEAIEDIKDEKLMFLDLHRFYRN